MRENRTSGSVRGALGNWRSYRERSAWDLNLFEIWSLQFIQVNNKRIPRIVKISTAKTPSKKFIRRYRSPRGGSGKVHTEYFRKLGDQLVRQRSRIELDYRRRPKEYLQHLNEGFTIGKAIRDGKGSTIKVYGRVSMPDLVDYKEDRIYDLKTIIWSLIFCLPKDNAGKLGRFTADEVVKLVVHKNKQQLERYLKAYWLSRHRIATLMLSIEGFDRRIVCGFHPAIGEWFIVEDEIKTETIKWWLDKD